MKPKLKASASRFDPIQKTTKLNKSYTRRSEATNKSANKETLSSVSIGLPLSSFVSIGLPLPYIFEEELNMDEKEPIQPPRRTLHDYLANILARLCW